MSDKGKAIVGNLMDAYFDVLRNCSAYTSIIRRYDQAVPGQVLYYRLPALRVAGQTGNEHERYAFPMRFVIKINVIDYRVRHFLKTSLGGWGI
jgi:hypothetical protein